MNWVIDTLELLRFIATVLFCCVCVLLYVYIRRERRRRQRMRHAYEEHRQRMRLVYFERLNDVSRANCSYEEFERMCIQLYPTIRDVLKRQEQLDAS